MSRYFVFNAEQVSTVNSFAASALTTISLNFSSHASRSASVNGIPARILAAIAKMGSSVEEMLQDYPALTQEGLDAALAFADANPRSRS